MPVSKPALRLPRFAKLAILLAIIVLLIAVRLAAQASGIDLTAIRTVMAQHGAWAPAIFVAAHTVAPALLLPCSPLTVLAGLFWGPMGVVYSVLGALGGSIFTFLLSRYLLRDQIRGWLRSSYLGYLAWITGKADRYGWRMIGFTQMTPILPGSMLGYFYGLSHIRFRTFVWATAAFMLPLQFAFAFLGDSIYRILAFKDADMYYVSIGITAGLFAFFFLFKFAAGRALRESGMEPDSEAKPERGEA